MKANTILIVGLGFFIGLFALVSIESKPTGPTAKYPKSLYTQAAMFNGAIQSNLRNEYDTRSVKRFAASVQAHCPYPITGVIGLEEKFEIAYREDGMPYVQPK